MTRISIMDTPEFKLACPKAKKKVLDDPKRYPSQEEIAALAGITIDDLKVKVKTNTGETIDVAVNVQHYSIFPSSRKTSYKLITASDGKPRSVYMVSGTKPEAANKTTELQGLESYEGLAYKKGTVFFTATDFAESKDVQRIKKKFNDAVEKYFDALHASQKKALAASHLPIAKKASKELVPLADEHDAGRKLHDWFTINGFEINGVNIAGFNKLAKDIKTNGHLSTSWTISSKPDNWGHQTGSEGIIDFAAKKVQVSGWSSDD